MSTLLVWNTSNHCLALKRSSGCGRNEQIRRAYHSRRHEARSCLPDNPSPLFETDGSHIALLFADRIQASPLVLSPVVCLQRLPSSHIFCGHRLNMRLSRPLSALFCQFLRARTRLIITAVAFLDRECSAKGGDWLSWHRVFHGFVVVAATKEVGGGLLDRRLVFGNRSLDEERCQYIEHDRNAHQVAHHKETVDENMVRTAGRHEKDFRQSRPVVYHQYLEHGHSVFLVAVEVVEIIERSDRSP